MQVGPPYPLVPLGLAEVCGQPQLGHEGQGLPHGEVGQQPVVLPHVGHAPPHQLRGAGGPVDQHPALPHLAPLVPTRDDVQQGRLAAAWGGSTHVHILLGGTHGHLEQMDSFCL